MTRYDRQERIPNWNQQKLNDAEIAVVGAGTLGSFVAAAFAGLGIGKLKIYDASKADNGLLEKCVNGCAYRVENIERLVSAINPSVTVRGYCWKFLEDYFADILGKPSVIVHCSNDVNEKFVVNKYGVKHGIPVINGYAAETTCGVSVVNKKELTDHMLFPGYHDKRQGKLTSLLAAGVIVDEARKIVMPLYQGEKPMDYIFNYNLESSERFEDKKDFELYSFDKQKSVCVVGAGSIGNIICLGLAALGMENVAIYDDDVVEEVNLNRQILFYDSVGRQKAEALAEKYRKLVPGAKVEAYNEKFGLGAKKYDLVVACTDSFKSRKLIDEYAKRHKIPAIFGGTDFDSGQVISYVPGVTTCINCQLNIEKLAAEEAAAEAERCAHVPEPSVIVSNWIIAALMAAEIPNVLNNRNKPVNGRIGYDSKQPRRLGLCISKMFAAVTRR